MRNGLCQKITAVFFTIGWTSVWLTYVTRPQDFSAVVFRWFYYSPHGRLLVNWGWCMFLGSSHCPKTSFDQNPNVSIPLRITADHGVEHCRGSAGVCPGESTCWLGSLWLVHMMSFGMDLDSRSWEYRLTGHFAYRSIMHHNLSKVCYCFFEAIQIVKKKHQHDEAINLSMFSPSLTCEYLNIPYYWCHVHVSNTIPARFSTSM